MYEVTMPKLSDSMEVGKILAWRVAEGDQVREGEVLAEIESDKATMELECFREGTLSKILFGDDTEVRVGEVIALIAEKGEAAAAPESTPRLTAAAPAPKPETHAGEETVPPPLAPPAPTDRRSAERIVASPYARKLAAERGLDLSGVRGTGPGGRIIARDVERSGAVPSGEAAVEASPPNAEPGAAVLAERLGTDLKAVAGTGVGGRITTDDVAAAHRRAAAARMPPSPDEELPPLDFSEGEAEVEEAPFRMKTLARRVTASKHLIPHFYITRGVEVSPLMAMKDRLKREHGATLTHGLMFAAVKAIERHPEVNRSYDRGRLIKWRTINIGLAVATDQGLTVAVLRDAAGLSLADLADRTRSLVQRARDGKLSAEERRHATFTVSNLGMFDVEHFAPIVNPPSAVTMAVASALETPVVRQGRVVAGRVMRLTLSCDHRVIDGEVAAAFLRDLKGLLESPGTLLGA